MTGYVFSWYTNESSCDKCFDTEDEAVKYAEYILSQLDEDDIGKNDIFEVIEVECTEEEWEEMESGDGSLVPADYSKRIVMSFNLKMASLWMPFLCVSI